MCRSSGFISLLYVFPLFLSAIIATEFPNSRILHLYNIVSYTSTFSSTFFLSTVISRKTKKKLKLLIYGAGGTFMLFIATITGLFTYHRI